jgi:hypothetical protein
VEYLAVAQIVAVDELLTSQEVALGVEDPVGKPGGAREE